MSRGFVCCLIGIGLTIFSWFGPWAWPAWPALTVIDSAYGSNSNFAEEPFNTRAAVVVGLIVLNVATWAVVIAGSLFLGESVLRRRNASGPPGTGQKSS